MARRRAPEPPLDPFERAARRSDPDYAQLAEAAEATPPSSWRAPRLLLMFGLLVAVAAVANGGRTPGPSLRPSCTTAAFALGSDSVTRDAPMTWSAVGPETGSVALALDSPVRPSVALLDGPTPLTGCVARGSFAFRAARGKHQVTAYLLSADGTTTAIASKQVTVV
ncbi:MAG: hypothetical protein JWO22_4134 [Frankiales bacterium]|nr:hypothetical protein [Frankiales bacterium]